MKKIALADFGEFWYGDYKEPFEQLEGAIPGHPVGVLLKDDAGKVLCAYCGKTFDNLGSHVKKHGLDSRSYKREVGLLQKSALVSERGRLARVANGKRLVNHLGGRDAARAWLRDQHAKHRVYRPNKPMRTPEVLNRTGRCYSQLLAIGRTVLTNEGRVSGRTLRKYGINETAVLAFWSSLDDFRAAVSDTYRAPRRDWTEEQLIAAVRGLAMKLGRTPAHSDLRRWGLPDGRTFAKHFGSYSKACERAGLIPNLPAPLQGDAEVTFLVAYATLGHMRKACRLTATSEHQAVAMFARYGAPFTPNTAAGRDSTARRAWAADMARRLAGEVAAA